MAKLNSSDTKSKRYPVGSADWFCLCVCNWVYPANRPSIVPFFIRQPVGDWVLTKFAKAYLYCKAKGWL